MITMSVLALIGYIAGALGIVATLSAAVVIVRATASKTTIDSQKELIATLLAGKEEQKDQIADLHAKHVESIKAIGNLQGQIDVLKNIPLKEISEDLKKLSQNQTTIAKDQSTIATEASKTASTQRDIIKLLKPMQPANA